MKKLIKLLVCLATGLFVFTACDDDDNNRVNYREVSVADGVFILNEGSYFSQVNGSLDYLDYGTGIVSRNVFQAANGRALGGTPNNAIIVGQKMYIATQEENRIEVVDVKTQKALTPISVIAPRELCTDGTNVYVSSYTGEVSKIDTLSLQVILKSDVVGANLEGIAYRQGYIYVCNAWNNDYTYNTNLVKLNAETLQKVTDIQVVANPNQLIADGDELFLASWGNYIDITGTIQHIALNDFVTKMAHATYMAYSERSKHLYLIGIAYDENWNENYTYTVCGWRSDRQEALEGEFIKGDEIQSPCAIGVDPVTRDVFISSRKKYPNAEGVMTVSYSQDGYVARYTTNGTYVGSYDCGVNPGTLLFVSHQELQPESD